MVLRKRPSAVAALSIVLACSTPTEPLEFVQPPLAEFEIHQIPFPFQGDWGLHLRAVADTDTLTMLMRIAVQVRTSSGDAETFALKPEREYISERGRGVTMAFMLHLEPGRHMEEVRPRLHEVDGRLSYVSFDGSWGTMRLFGEDLEPAMETAQRWPGVWLVERATSTIQDLSRTDLTWILDHRVGRWALVHFASPVPGDGVVQAQAGDTIAVVYRQPGGSTTVTEAVMCEPPPGYGTPIVGLGEIPPCG